MTPAQHQEALDRMQRSAARRWRWDHVWLPVIRFATVVVLAFTMALVMVLAIGRGCVDTHSPSFTSVTR